MKNDRIICDFAKTLRMYEASDGRQCSQVEETLERATQAGLDAVLLQYLVFDCPAWFLESLNELPGRKQPIIHYAKSIFCPRYFRG